MEAATNQEMNYNEALDLLENGYAEKCIVFFQENNYLLEYGYALFMLGKTDDAKQIFEQINSVRADWAKKLISIIMNNFDSYPTYFQIRNFLEIDINMLLKHRKTDLTQAILNYAQFFQDINNESYKFFARALLKNGFSTGCKYFLDKSADAYYNDVELQFLFVEYYMFMNEPDNAKKSVKKCLSINPEYYPAIKAKEELKL